MPYKDPEKRKAANRAWFKKSGYAGQKKRARKLFEAVRSIKEAGSCIICGEKDPIVLQFHHRDPGQKLAAVSRLIQTGTLDTILKEIKKCDLLCANCHMRKHYSEPYL